MLCLARRRAGRSIVTYIVPAYDCRQIRMCSGLWVQRCCSLYAAAAQVVFASPAYVAMLEEAPSAICRQPSVMQCHENVACPAILLLWLQLKRYKGSAADR